jgi:hypothetical protein
MAFKAKKKKKHYFHIWLQLFQNEIFLENFKHKIFNYDMMIFKDIFENWFKKEYSENKHKIKLSFNEVGVACNSLCGPSF